MKKNTIGRLSKAFAQSIVCLGLSVAPAAASTIMGCAAIEGDSVSGALPAYQRLSLDGTFGAAGRLLTASVLGAEPTLSVMSAAPASGAPCEQASFAGMASASLPHAQPRQAAVDAFSTASIGGDRQTGAGADGPFGSVALPFGSLPALKRMQPIYQAMRQHDLFSCGTDCSDARASLKMVVSAVADADFVTKIEAVNTAVNHILSYRRDIDSYGRNDHWATPREALERRVGDCEDYAILKMAALDRLGVPMKSMSLVVLRDQQRKLFHAVLAIRTSQGFFILDNLRSGVASDRAYPQYLALYAVSAGRGYIYGRALPRHPAVASATHLDGVAPGEGPGERAADAGLFLEAALSADAVPID